MTSLADRQLQAARDLAAHVAPRLQGDLSLQLWNGEVLPLGPGARNDIRVGIRSPGTIRRMLLRPGLMTVFELYANVEVDIAVDRCSKRWHAGTTSRRCTCRRPSTSSSSRKRCGHFFHRAHRGQGVGPRLDREYSGAC